MSEVSVVYEQKREELIRSGVALLTEKGFSTVGIDEILGQVGVPKGSFHYYFKNKESFGKEIVKKYNEYFCRKLDFYFGDQELLIKDRLKSFIEAQIQSMVRYNFRRGCLLGNLSQELNILPKTLAQEVSDSFLCWQLKLQTCFEEAQQNGEILADSNCKMLSNVFWSGWEGAVLRARLDHSTLPLEEFAQFFINCVFR